MAKLLNESSSGPVKDGLRIAYLNVKCALKKMDQLRFLAHRHDLDVFFVSESMLPEGTQNSAVSIANYKMERKDRKADKGGGILAYVKENHNYNTRAIPGEGNYKKLEYINLCINLNEVQVNIIGTYLPGSKEEIEADYNTLFEEFGKSSYKNVAILGDMNINKNDSKSPSAPPTFKQWITNYTRIGFNAAPWDKTQYKYTNTLIDHIYTYEMSDDAMVQESGVVHCGISDHALIYCTLLPEAKMDEPNLKKHGDLLRHDFPILLSALVAVSSGCDAMLERDTKFWAMARIMENRRIELSEQVLKPTDKMKALLTQPLNFCEELSRRSEGQTYPPLSSVIKSVKRREIHRHHGSHMIYDELEFYLSTGILSNIADENIFLSSRTKFFNFCFQDPVTLLPNTGLRIINPVLLPSEEIVWDSLSELLDKESNWRGLVVRYKRQDVHPPLFASWCADRFEWSKAVISGRHSANHMMPLGMIETINTMYHQWVREELMPLISSSKRPIGYAYNRDREGVIAVGVTDAEWDQGKKTLASVNKALADIESIERFWIQNWTLLDESNSLRRIDTVSKTLKAHLHIGKYKLPQRIIEAEDTTADDIQLIISALLNPGASSELKVETPEYWLKLLKEHMIQRGQIGKYERLLSGRICRICIHSSWPKLIESIKAKEKHEAAETEQCLQRWLMSIKSSITNGTMGLHSKMVYFNLHVIPDLLEGCWNNRKIINPREFWKCDHYSPSDSLTRISREAKGQPVLLIGYKASEYWHGDLAGPPIWDHPQSWAEFTENSHASWMDELDNVICHSNLSDQLNMYPYEGDVIFTSKEAAMVYLHVPLVTSPPSTEDDDGAHQLTTTTLDQGIAPVIEQIITSLRENGNGIKKELVYTFISDNIKAQVDDSIKAIMNKYKHIAKRSYAEFKKTHCP